MEWSQVKFWSGKYSCTFHHKIQQDVSKSILNEWLIGLAYQIYYGKCLSVLSNLFRSGAESNFRVANVFLLYLGQKKKYLWFRWSDLPCLRPPIHKLFSRFLPLTNKLFAIFRIFRHFKQASPWLSTSAKMVARNANLWRLSRWILRNWSTLGTVLLCSAIFWTLKLCVRSKAAILHKVREGKPVNKFKKKVVLK